MLRHLFALIVLLALVAMVTRARGPRRVVWVVLGLMVVYTVLKLTGAIEAMAPDRSGVF
jgi:hypothetical protein